MAVSLALGVIIALTYMYKSNYTKSFVVSLILLPAIVQAVILLVNGNVGTGIAVAGAFSLIRFRSATGSAKDITTIFLAMAAGLATGIGEIFFAMIFVGIVCAAYFIVKLIPFADGSHNMNRHLKITVPEDLNFEGVFENVLKKYTAFFRLEQIKTTNMGSMFYLTYHIILNKNANEKAFIDELRVCNGNLPIVIGDYKNDADQL
jgi:hypothetical protein